MGRIWRVNTRLLIFLAVVGLTVPAGCAEDRPNVVVIGDSLTAWSAPHVADTVRSMGWDVTVDARPGWTIRGFDAERWVPIIQELMRTRDPSVVVIELGTNTCDGCTLSAEIDEVLEAVGDRPVRWLNVRTFVPIPKDPQGTNRALADAAKRHSNLKIIDFDRAFRGHPEWVVSDQIHMSPEGARALALVIGSGVGTAPAD